MLSYKNRLLKKNDFQRVFKKGKSIKSDFLFLKFCDNNLNESRFGIIVSKKVSKRAVDRNKIKRKTRHRIKELLPEIKKGKDVALIILFKKEEIKIKEIFQKAGLL